MSSKSTISLLHDDGEHIVVSASKAKDPATKSRLWLSKGCTDITEAADWIDRRSQEGYNVYVRHANHDGAEKQIASGRTYPAAEVSHFPASRSFFLDIDVGPTRFYLSDDAALTALKNACTALAAKGVPPPTLVQLSGGGVQAVWTVTDPFPGDEWRRLGALLYELLEKEKVRFDAGAAPIDRGVRVCGPGYGNVNHGASRPTQVLRHNHNRIPSRTFKQALDPHTVLRVVGGTDNVVSRPAADDDEFAVQSADKFELDISVIAEDCLQIAEALATEGEKHTRDHWINLISLISKNGNEEYGREIAHLISAKHPSDDPAETNKKFDEFRKSPNKAYTTCARFDKSNKGLCPNCAFYNIVNSPAGIQNRRVVVASSTPGAGPAMPTVGQRGSIKILGGPYYNTGIGICKEKNEDDDKTRMIWKDVRIDNVALHRIDGNEDQLILTFDYGTSDGKSKAQGVALDVNRASSPQATATMLAGGYGIMLASTNLKPVHDAMVSWKQRLQSRGDYGTHYTKLGWSSNNDAFVLGSSVYHTDGKRTAFFANPRMQRYDPKGDLKAYNAVVGDVLGKDFRPEAHAFVAAAFAAPLLKRMGAPGLAINLFSATGHGKTTLTKIASSVWGPPSALGMGVDDTDNAAIKILAELNNLPGFYDEVKRSERELADWLNRFVFRLSGQSEKARLSANSQHMERGSWQTFMLFATNYCFAEIMRRHTQAADAGVARVMDLELGGLPDGSLERVADVNLAISTLEHNYGFPGHAYVSHLVTNVDKVINYLRHYLSKLMRVSASTAADVSGRNHAAAGAAMVVAAAIVKQLGIMPLEPKLVEIAVTKAIKAGSTVRVDAKRDTSPLALLSNYLKQKEDSRLTTVVSSTTTGKRKDYFDARRPMTRTVCYEVDLTKQNLLVDIGLLLAWLRENGYPTTSTIGALEKQYKKDRMSLGRGIEGYSGVKRDVLVIPGTGDFSDFFEVSHAS